MEDKFEVLFDGNPVGKAEVVKQGLYYIISGRCRMNIPEMCRLVVRWKDGWENLGIMLPEGDGFCLNKKIPVKHIGAGPYSFVLVRLSESPEGILFPKYEEPAKEMTIESIISGGNADFGEEEEILEEKPFSRMGDLSDAHLEIRDGHAVAVFDGDYRSDLQDQADGAVVGAQDVSIDGGGDNLIPDSV